MLSATKQNPSAKLRLVGSAQPPQDAPDNAVPSLLWSIYESDGVTSSAIDLAIVSSTGSAKANLVIGKDVLNPGASYTFELRATYATKSAVATSFVRMNRPPYGGTFDVLYTAPAVALTTSITLQVCTWAYALFILMLLTIYIDTTQQ